jgi:hypothetical protein
MKGAILVLETMMPLVNPTMAPAPTPANKPGTIPYCETSAEVTLPKAATAPTDKSIPPVKITNAIPSDTSANMEL